MFCPADGIQCAETPNADCYTCFECAGHWVAEDGTYHLPPSGEECPSCGRVVPEDAPGMRLVFADGVVPETEQALGRLKVLEEAVGAALSCLEEVLEDTDDGKGNRVPNPLLVQLRAAARKE